MAQARMGDDESEAITYGDVFKAKGNLAKQPVTPGDAALMQSAETLALGQNQKGGVAALMQAAAQANEKVGLVSKDNDTVARAEGMTVTETAIPGRKVTVECVGGQLVSSDVQPSPAPYATAAASYVTIGEALEAAALTTWDKPVEQSDAAAIQSAVRRATGAPEMLPGSVAATAQSAADINPRLPYEERTTLADILFTASEDLPADKVVMMEDAHKIKESEARQSVSGEVFRVVWEMRWRPPPELMSKTALTSLARSTPLWVYILCVYVFVILCVCATFFERIFLEQLSPVLNR